MVHDSPERNLFSLDDLDMTVDNVVRSVSMNVGKDDLRALVAARETVEFYEAGLAVAKAAYGALARRCIHSIYRHEKNTDKPWECDRHEPDGYHANCEDCWARAVDVAREILEPSAADPCEFPPCKCGRGPASEMTLEGMYVCKCCKKEAMAATVMVGHDGEKPTVYEVGSPAEEPRIPRVGIWWKGAGWVCECNQLNAPHWTHCCSCHVLRETDESDVEFNPGDRVKIIQVIYGTIEYFSPRDGTYSVKGDGRHHGDFYPKEIIKISKSQERKQ